MAAIFRDSGMFMSGANGPTVLTYSEIESFINLTGLQLSPSEILILRGMSQAFVNSLMDDDPSTPPPYSVRTSAPEDLSERLKASLLSRAKKT